MASLARHTPPAKAVTLAGIRRAAEETLAAWPEARAAVLFGSRARGDHLPSSDWDIAFITRTGTHIGYIPEGLPIEALPCEVQALALPEAVARRKALSIGHVGRGVVRDGTLLAGGWTRPGTRGKLTMEPEEYGLFTGNAAERVGFAVAAAARVGRNGSWLRANSQAASFVTHSGGAAEHLAKAMLGRYGIDPERSHDVDRLAEQAERAGHSDLAENIRRMDGYTQRDNVATYGFRDTDRLRHAIQRLPVVIRQLERELASASGLPKYVAQVESVAVEAVETAFGAEDTLRLAIARDGADLSPPPPHRWLAPLVEARASLLSELLKLQTALQPLTGRETEPVRGAWRSPSPFG